MAEGHSEDYPLLGDVDLPSPTRSLSGSRTDAEAVENWPILENEPCDESVEEKSNTINSLRNYHKPVGIHKHNWSSVNSNETLTIPNERLSPKTVHSQSSMDSGCDCDPSDGDANSQDNSTKNRKGSSTPSINQSGSSDTPSTTHIPLSSKASLECQCDTSDQKFVCDKKHSDFLYQNNNASMACGKNQINSKVTFKIEGDNEIDVVYDDLLGCPRFSVPTMTINTIEVDAHICLEPEDAKALARAAKNFPRVASFTKTGMLSSSSSTASMPICRICHLPQGDGLDMLISPCRCAGTMQFIHEGCLTKWLEISAKRAKKSPTCELCNYQFNRHKKFRLRHWKLPTCSFVDKALHAIFLLCIVVMATSASITIYCFKQDKFIRKREDTDLTQSEIITLTCGVLFFVAFFVAMYVEVKANDTIYRLFSRFLYLNQTWHIGEYDKTKDIEASHSPV